MEYPALPHYILALEIIIAINFAILTPHRMLNPKKKFNLGAAPFKFFFSKNIDFSLWFETILLHYFSYYSLPVKKHYLEKKVPEKRMAPWKPGRKIAQPTPTRAFYIIVHFFS